MPREIAVILAPNHVARGPRAAIISEGAFAFPGAVVPIDERLSESIRGLGGLTEAPEVFAEDHGIEELLPLLVSVRPMLRIVPIALHSISAHTAARVGAAIADAIIGHGGGVTIVATTDLAHYADETTLEALCTPVLESAAALDDEALVRAIEARASRSGPVIEMCGFGALLTAVFALRSLGASPGVIVSRGSSREVPGEMGGAVGYGAITFAAR